MVCDAKALILAMPAKLEDELPSLACRISFGPFSGAIVVSDIQVNALFVC